MRKRLDRGDSQAILTAPRLTLISKARKILEESGDVFT